MHLGGIETQAITALVAATAFGTLLGLERSLAGKHAGMRTYALVALGSCLFTLVGVIASMQLSFFSGINPLQIAGSVAIGIGFIGTGLSLLKGEHPAEITTASGVWLSAAVGVTCGLGFYAIAFVATILGLLIFSLLLRVENYFRRSWSSYGKE